MSTHAALHPIRTVPVLIAFLLNLVAPVASIAVPAGAPLARTETAMAATDPMHVGLTLEGCRNPSVNLETTGFVCADADYTTGNLGKTWNELDLVPHRLTSALGTQADATTTYTIGIAADGMDAGHPGYDVMSVPVVNTALSDASCAVIAGPQVTITPGVGGTDSSIGRLFTISQDKGTTCVFDWYERLALGSHLFPGSSLHTNRTNQSWSTSGIGAADVSIPVKEILPQELSKDMSAERGQTYSWAVDKSTDDSPLTFLNTCADTAGALSADVQITVTWTRSGPTGSGSTTITTHVYATNPAHRTITVNATDKIYAGADQSVLLDTFNTGNVNVAAGSTDLLIGTHSFVYAGAATHFNDVATATYTDLVTGIPVPGNTTATASADTVASQGAIANSSVTISDTESITGEGLSFSVAAPSVGAFDGYVAGTGTTGPVNWSATATNSGSVTFSKTVMLDEPRITSGSLDDTATITGDGDNELSFDSASIVINADAQVALTIHKSIPNALNSDTTFAFRVTGPGGYDETFNLTIPAGQTSASIEVGGLEPGSYTVHENAKAGWASQADEVVDLTLPNCSGTATFTNSPISIAINKTNEFDGQSVVRGQEIDFTIDVDVTNGPAHDAVISDTLPLGLTYLAGSASPSTGFSVSVNGSGQQVLTWMVDELTGSDNLFTYTATVNDDAEGTLTNLACVDSLDTDEICDDSTVDVTPPSVTIVKTNDASESTVTRGSTVGYDLEVTVSNGPAHDVVVNDTLPAGVVYKDGTALPASGFSVSADGHELTWTVGTLDTGTYHFTYDGLVENDAPLNQELTNVGCVAASDDEVNDETNPICDDSTIEVQPPQIQITKTENDADDIVVIGQSIHYTLTVTVTDGPMQDVVVTDAIPAGLTYVADSAAPSTGFTATGQDLEWIVGELANGAYTFQYDATVDNDATGSLTNLGCVDAEVLEEPLCDQTTVEIIPPTLVIEKAADTDLITISGPPNAETASPSSVTWTLTYTLTNGPVTNAVITDPIPTGFTFVSATNGGTLGADGKTITWNLGTLSASGSVSFVTSVNVATISRTAPTENIAVIKSDQTPSDEGRDSVRVRVIAPPLAGNPSPTPKVPNTAVAFGPSGQPITVPIELLVVLFLGSLGGLALANVRAVQRRRR